MAGDTGVQHWYADSVPLRSIGQFDGADHDMLGAVTGAYWLAGDRLLVADAQARRIHAYDEAGKHLFSAGGAGEGPGEFRNLQWAMPFGRDSILAWDFELARGSVFDSAGAFVRQIRLEPLADHPLLYVDHVAADGMLIVQSGPPRRSAGDRWGWIRFLTYHEDGASHFTLGELPLRECLEDRPSCVPGANTATATWATHDETFYHMRGDSAAVVGVDRSGRNITHFSAAAALGGADPSSPAAPQGSPAADRLLVDELGYIWIRAYRSPHWFVFDSAGHQRKRVRIPTEYQVHQVKSDRVLASATDANGVVRVVEIRMLPADAAHPVPF